MQDFIKFRKMITPPYHPDPVLGGRGRYGHRRAGDDGQQLRTLWRRCRHLPGRSGLLGGRSCHGANLLRTPHPLLPHE